MGVGCFSLSHFSVNPSRLSANTPVSGPGHTHSGLAPGLGCQQNLFFILHVNQRYKKDKHKPRSTRRKLARENIEFAQSWHPINEENFSNKVEATVVFSPFVDRHI